MNAYDEGYAAGRASALEQVEALKAHLALEMAERDRLQCCGNCKWFAAEEFQYCDEPERHALADKWSDPSPYYISAPDRCDFRESRWQPREENA